MPTHWATSAEWIDYMIESATSMHKIFNATQHFIRSNSHSLSTNANPRLWKAPVECPSHFPLRFPPFSYIRKSLM